MACLKDKERRRAIRSGQHGSQGLDHTRFRIVAEIHLQACVTRTFPKANETFVITRQWNRRSQDSEMPMTQSDQSSRRMTRGRTKIRVHLRQPHARMTRTRHHRAHLSLFKPTLHRRRGSKQNPHRSRMPSHQRIQRCRRSPTKRRRIHNHLKLPARALQSRSERIHPKQRGRGQRVPCRRHQHHRHLLQLRPHPFYWHHQLPPPTRARAQQSFLFQNPQRRPNRISPHLKLPRQFQFSRQMQRPIPPLQTLPQIRRHLQR